jgi:[ribosomal protein S5]-alanine N-acetyltransferase
MLKDAADVQRLAGDREIAATTLSIPHPYEDGMAQAWIATHPGAFEQKKAVTFAIALPEDGTLDLSTKQPQGQAGCPPHNSYRTGLLCGSIGLAIDPENNHAELGYWIGKPYWGQGYCTEAARAVLQYGFTTIELHRIHACHFPHNPASGRVMQKIGMTYEGCRRQHILKWGQYEDVIYYGILNSEWQQ